MTNENKADIHPSSFIVPRSGLWVVVLVCAALYAVLYGPAILQAAFLNDDWFHIEPIPRDRFVHLFYGDWHQGYRNIGGFYRPLPRILMQLARQGFDLSAPLYLLIPAILHVANCLLVWLLAMRLARPSPPPPVLSEPPPASRDPRSVPASPPSSFILHPSSFVFPRSAFVAALVFAVYPTHPEALLQISMIADLMAACGILLALLAYLALRESPSLRHWIAALAGALLGALSKESWIALPLILLWVEWVWRAEPRRLLPDARAWRRMGVFVVLGLVYVAFRHAVLGGTGGYGNALTFASARQTLDAVFQLVVLPFAEIGRWSDLINVFTILGVLLILWALLDFAPLLLFALGWMGLTTLPILTLSPQLHDGGRLVYVAVVGWALFLGGAFDRLIAMGRTARVRRVIAWMGALVLALLIAAQIAHTRDWRASFQRNHRLVAEALEIVNAQPPDTHFAVLGWPRRFGVALSNRPDSAAKAIATLAGIAPHRMDGLLAPDVSTGTMTFSVTQDLRLSIGRVERADRQQWAGDRLEQWQPWGEAQLAHLRSDGSRDFALGNKDAGLVSPDLSGRTGFYSILVIYQPVRLHWGSVMWQETDDEWPPSRRAMLSPLARRGDHAELAEIGWVSLLRRVAFLPATGPGAVTIQAIEIARFEIAPFERKSWPRQ